MAGWLRIYFESKVKSEPQASSEWEARTKLSAWSSESRNAISPVKQIAKNMCALSQGLAGKIGIQLWLLELKESPMRNQKLENQVQVGF